MVKLDAFQGAINHRLQFVRVLYLASLGQSPLRFLGADPGGAAIGFLGTAHLMNFHEKSLDHKLLHASRLPEHAFRMNVEMEVSRLYGSNRTGFLCRFA